ncbi:kinesin-associated protein 3, putative [Ichthyophthirius multifiliis]|uniref:Kinesin-associated protein 3, putative n=1 Tax=Ichthyophthirius multifiliis TaxID=5932 RepID=G0QZN7_ICHMU|nr:kinesin-associated protein 3, putative [Ichthyophthirius multifiliis]EGR29311.1 kinesin-associated protein 3, putative [Ichthyophthirius multifiliis]|eukprot:XP_004030547.1 kinesin-associated protein 3, putative [Ichthyophthirius multifiliis]
MELDKNNKNYEKELKKLNMMIARQDKLFYISLTILLNMAEDYQIEKKMKNRKIVTILIRMLERNDFHLLIVTLLFLKKLSIIRENKNQMLEDGLVEKLGRFFTCQNNLLLQLASGLLKNIAFDKNVREQIEKENYIPKIIELLKTPNFRFTSLVLLYMLSLDDKTRNTFSYTECINLVVKLIIHFPEQSVGKELVSLAINLAANQQNADVLSEEELQVVIDRAIKNQDILLFKFIKNIAIYAEDEEVHNCLQNNIPKFIKLGLTKSKIEDLKYEIIGILSNIKHMGDKWVNYLNNSFIEFIHNNLSDQAVEDDIIIETIQLAQTICYSPQCAETLAKNKLMITIAGLLLSKIDDEEFVAQNLFALYQFLQHKIGIQFIIEQDDIIQFLLNNISDRNPVIQKVNDDVLDIIREYQPELSERIKQRKYYEFNREWIQSLDGYDSNAIGADGYEFGNDIKGQNFGFNEHDDHDLDPKMWDSDTEL